MLHHYTISPLVILLLPITQFHSKETEKSEARAKCIELFGLCSDMSDSKENFGINKGAMEDGEEEK